tara:strand:- start:854 stop:2257 length:1404 start_codon:yes stop_codon:yes gene_type:complete
MEAVRAAREQLECLERKALDESKDVIELYRKRSGDDVARTATDPEKRDEELKKIAKDVIKEVNASLDRGLAAEDLNPVWKEFSTQVADLRKHIDNSHKELATSQGDALRDALQGVLTKLDTLVAEREKASETTGPGETNVIEKIEALRVVVDANAATLKYIESKVAVLGGKMDKMEHRINVNTAAQLKTVSGLAKELHGSENNAPSVALDDVVVTPTQTNVNDDQYQYTGKKNSKKSSTANTAATTTTKGATCMAIKKGDGKRCGKACEAGYLTCRYEAHRVQEQELREKLEKSGVPRTDSTASIQDTATNAQAPPTTAQPSVAQCTRKSKLKPPGVNNKKRKRGDDDEEELEHTDHSPDEIVDGCPACDAGCGQLTQPSHILHSEQADQRDYDPSFDSPGPEERVAHGLPPSPPLNGPIRILPSPTSTDADRLEAEQTGFRNQDELMEELRRGKHRQGPQQPPWLR